MHGQPRAKADASLNEAQKLEQKERRTKKAQLFGELCKRVLDAHASDTHSATLLKMSEKLVQMNPEMYTIWNYRRAHLSPIFLRGGDEAVDASSHELAVTKQALMASRSLSSTTPTPSALTSSAAPVSSSHAPVSDPNGTPVCVRSEPAGFRDKTQGV